MAEVTIPKEKMNYTIDLLITMVTDEIAEETGKDRKEVLTDFLCSKTGKALYDEKTKTITCSITITVRPVKGKLPTIKDKEWKEGETVSGCALSLEPAKTGTVTWKSPAQKADKSGWYPVLFCPADSDNYDWSSYEQDEKGNICMQVYLTVTPKPTS